MERTRRAFAISLGLLGAVALAQACGGSGDGGSSVSGGTGASGNSGGSGGGFGTGGNGSGGFAAGFGSGGSDSGGLTADSACANETVTAERIPVAIYIMLDKSGSMKGTKWSDTKTGLQAFVTDPASTGLKVALQYFPIGSGQCDGTGYATPAVPMAALPGNATPIMNSINATSPANNTPTEGALNGLERFCKNYSKAHPAEKCVGLLVTDGQPNGCNETPSVLTGIAADAFGTAPSVPIYAMGMSGADFTFLDAVAKAGGTNKSYDVSSGGANAFSTALKAIAGQVLTCSYKMPTTDGGTVNPASIIMNYTDASGTSKLDQVADKAACTTTGGFYYDNPQTPSTITLCPATCTKVQGNAKGKIEILLDCTKLGPA